MVYYTYICIVIYVNILICIWLFIYIYMCVCVYVLCILAYMCTIDTSMLVASKGLQSIDLGGRVGHGLGCSTKHATHASLAGPPRTGLQLKELIAQKLSISTDQRLICRGRAIKDHTSTEEKAWDTDVGPFVFSF